MNTGTLLAVLTLIICATVQQVYCSSGVCPCLSVCLSVWKLKTTVQKWIQLDVIIGHEEPLKW